jgi:predicted ATP-dependent endonuclease of OLD family
MSISNIYIKELKIENYKSLKNSSLELQEGLNIIIGPNGAGKSNLLDFINRYVGDVISWTTQNILPNFSISLNYFSNEIKVLSNYTVRRDQFSSALPNTETSNPFELILNKFENGKQTIVDKKIKFNGRFLRGLGEKEEAILNELQTIGFLDKKYITFELPENVELVSKPGKLNIELVTGYDQPRTIFSIFRNIEFVLANNISNSDDSLESLKNNLSLFKETMIIYLDKYLKYIAINDYLPDYSPISEIRFSPNLVVYVKEDRAIVENLLIEFKIDTEWVPWTFLSDGTKRLFYLISECLSIKEGIILVEEPELGIHPHQLTKVLSFLKDQSRNKQVIVSTHSPLTLDIVDENELQRIIIATYKSGTKFHRLNTEESNKAKRYINEVGELSYYWLHSDLEK